MTFKIDKIDFWGPILHGTRGLKDGTGPFLNFDKAAFPFIKTDMQLRPP